LLPPEPAEPVEAGPPHAEIVVEMAAAALNVPL
jgi:hypothetical protein